MVDFIQDDWQAELFSDELRRTKLPKLKTGRTRTALLQYIKRLKMDLLLMIAHSMPDTQGWYVCSLCHTTMPETDVGRHECPEKRGQ